MNNFVLIYTKIWNDKKFRKLSANGKLIFLYLITNENLSLSGIYELDYEECQIKMKLNNNFDDSFQELINSKMIEWDNENEIIWIINRFKFITSKSAKVIVGAIEELNQINHKFKDLFIKKYDNIISPFFFKLDGHKIKEDDVKNDEFIINASKIYNTRSSLKRFFENKGIEIKKIDEIITRVLPNLR